MEYANHLNEYAPAWSAAQVDQEVTRLREAAKRNHNTDVYKMCYSAIDLTTLSCNDSVTSVTEFARKAAEFYQKYPHIPNVASICIYPAFVETVGLAVDGTPMRITSVGGGFPAAQTFLEVKALEVAMAVENGADEIDIVLNVGRMLTGEYDEAANEVEVIRSEMDGDIVLKVIIESGALKTPDLIRKASLLSMFAGADFVKTSTSQRLPRLRSSCARPSAITMRRPDARSDSRLPGESARPKTAHFTIPSLRRFSVRSGLRPTCSASVHRPPQTISFRRSRAGRSNISDLRKSPGRIQQSRRAAVFF